MASFIYGGLSFVLNLDRVEYMEMNSATPYLIDVHLIGRAAPFTIRTGTTDPEKALAAMKRLAHAIDTEDYA
jgi:hypothetical protein